MSKKKPDKEPDWEADPSHWLMAHEVIRLMLQGHKKKIAADEVAKDRGVSRSFVLDAYDEYIAELKRAELELAEYFDKHGERREVDIVKALVARYQREYERTNNPLHIWFAYAECRQAELQIPKWIFDYLDQVTENLWKLSKSPRPGEENSAPDKPAPAIAKALGMRGNVFKKFQDMSHFLMAHDVICLILDGSKETIAADEVVKDRGGSRSAVLEAYKKYANIIPHPKRPPPKSSKK